MRGLTNVNFWGSHKMESVTGSQKMELTIDIFWRSQKVETLLDVDRSVRLADTGGS